MSAWPDRRILDLFQIEIPILQAPMAGPATPELAIAVAEAGGLGSLPCALLNPAQIRTGIETIRKATARRSQCQFLLPHATNTRSGTRKALARAVGALLYRAGARSHPAGAGSSRLPFDNATCDLVETCRPEVVSFHFGLPERALLDRVKKTGAKILSSATTVAEARWLEAHGCDAVIAMGFGGGRTSRQFPLCRYGAAGRHLRLSAAGGRCRRNTGDRRRWRRRRARHRRRAGLGRLGGPDRHRLSLLARMQNAASASQSLAGGGG